MNPKTDSKKDFFDLFYKLDVVNSEIKILLFVENVTPNQELQKTAMKLSEKVSLFVNKWSLNKDLYDIIERFYKYYKKDFTKEEEKVMKLLLKNYRHNGVNLNEKTRDKLRDLNKKLALLSLSYMNNLLKVNDYLSFSKDELKGLDSDFLNSLEKKGKKYKITTKYDVVNKVLKYCETEETRKKVYKMFINRGKKLKNDKIFKEIIKLKHKKAHLLGWKTYADWVLSYGIEWLKTYTNLGGFHM